MGEYKYTNAIQLQVQIYDAQLKFGFETSGEIQDEVTMVLSPQHMKVLSKMLDNAVMQYEEQFGVINIPAIDEDPNDEEK